MHRHANCFHHYGRADCGDGGSGVNSVLYELDPGTGSVIRQIGSTGLTHITGLAFQPGTGVLFAHQNQQGTDIGKLYTINLSTPTPTASLIGVTHLSTPDITFASDGSLYGWAIFYEQNYPGLSAINQLVRFDLSNGQPTQIGVSANFFPSQVGFSFDRTGTLYLKSAAEIYTINPTTATRSLVTNLSAVTNNVLAFDASNQAYSITRVNPTESYLQRLNLSTGQVTTVGGNLGLPITALAFTPETAAVPEPQSIFAVLVSFVASWSHYSSKKRREGSSITSLIVLKKLTASRPSTMR
jgi:hypothetical protein